MIRLLFILLHLSHFVQGTNTNTTNSTCLAEIPAGSYRSLWSLLGSCAVTLVICIWHAVHLNVPEPGKELVLILGNHVHSVILGFCAPELLIGRAVEEWMKARQSVREFREKGYEWSMAHSYFADSGGFVYRNKEGFLKVINAFEFLDLCEAGKIVNPLITEKDIQDRSKSDAASKAIFLIQLFWFMLQIAVRYFSGLAVTLVEVDTLSMSLLAVFYLLLWWSKPLNAGSPHVFDETQEDKVYSPEELSKAWKSQSFFLYRLGMSIVRVCAMVQVLEDLQIWRVSAADRLSRWSRLPSMPIGMAAGSLAAGAEQATSKPSSAIFNKMIKMIKKIDVNQGTWFSFCFAWCVLGALHLAAWNPEFPMEYQASLWRNASLALTATGLAAIIGCLLHTKMHMALVSRPAFLLAWSVASSARGILLVLMFQSLSALPCSAHRTIPWVEYIPHL